jgi:excisionase family DNA binding protein
LLDTERTPERNELLSARDLARVLGVSRSTAYGLLWSGEIPSLKIGRSRKLRRTDLDKFVAERLELRDE